MFRRSPRTRLAWLVLIPLAWLLIAGCGQSKPPSLPPAQPPPGKVVLATHWIGKARLAQDTNAAYQMELWNLPESVQLEEQTLHKLARALPKLLGMPSVGDTNELTGVIRPLLDDLVQAESFTEVRVTGNQGVEIELAIRLSPERKHLWQSNITALKEAISKVTTTPLKLVQFTNTGDWAVLGLASDVGPQVAEFVSRLNATNPPTSSEKDQWVTLDADLSWWLRSHAILARQNLPSVQLTMVGEGQNVRTRAKLMFPESLGIELKPWQVPTNLIYDPLVSFAAVRGITRWFTSLPGWNGLPLGSLTEIYTWSMGGIPLQTYLASPDADASNRVDLLATALLERARPYFATNAFGRLERTATGGLNWADFPFLPASLESIRVPAGDFLVAGWSPQTGRTNRSTPPELLAQFLPRTNLVYYDWELTEARVDAWLYLGQTLRLTALWAQLPRDGSTRKWLSAISPKLGNCVSAVELIGDKQLALTRSASAGFTALELHVLAAWLESPDFPHGLHSINSKPGARLYRTSPAATTEPLNPPAQPLDHP